MTWLGAIDLIKALQDTFQQYRMSFWELLIEVLYIFHKCNINTERASKREPEITTALHESVVKSIMSQKIIENKQNPFFVRLFFNTLFLETVKA